MDQILHHVNIPRACGHHQQCILFMIGLIRINAFQTFCLSKSCLIVYSALRRHLPLHSALPAFFHQILYLEIVEILRQQRLRYHLSIHIRSLGYQPFHHLCPCIFPISAVACHGGVVQGSFSFSVHIIYICPRFFQQFQPFFPIRLIQPERWPGSKIHQQCQPIGFLNIYIRTTSDQFFCDFSCPYIERNSDRCMQFDTVTAHWFVIHKIFRFIIAIQFCPGGNRLPGSFQTMA